MGDTDIARVREVLIRELETINRYEELARASESPEIRAFFLHLAEEEKEHVAEATMLVRKLDPGQEAQFAKDFTQAHFAGGTPTSAPAAQAQPTLAVNRGPDVAAARPNRSSPSNPFADLRVPTDPRAVVHAIPAFPTAAAGALTVGQLKRRS